MRQMREAMPPKTTNPQGLEKGCRKIRASPNAHGNRTVTMDNDAVGWYGVR